MDDSIVFEKKIIDNKTPFLVDVPVRINIWIRSQCQEKQLEVIKAVKPSILFLVSDYGRNEKEKEIITANRLMVEQAIDWNCTIYKLYAKENKGLYTMGTAGYNTIWSHVDRCIMLEDDQIPSVSYFEFCRVLLEKYKDDTRIECICGMNHLGISKDVPYDYFFSRQGAIWGFATWKRVFNDRDNFDYNDRYTLSLLKKRTRHNRIAWKRLAGYLKNPNYEGHMASSEFWIEFNMYSQNRLQIVPTKNMIKNIGFGDDSAHSRDLKLLPRTYRKLFNMKTYEIEFPLKFNNYVIPDVEYEKARNKRLAYNYPLIRFFRKIEVLFLRTIHLNFKRKNNKHES